MAQLPNPSNKSAANTASSATRTPPHAVLFVTAFFRQLFVDTNHAIRSSIHASGDHGQILVSTDSLFRSVGMCRVTSTRPRPNNPITLEVVPVTNR